MPTVPELLYALPTERLKKLVEFREIDRNKLARVTSKQALVTLIAGELTRPESVVRAMMDCDVRELRLLQVAASCSSKGAVIWPVLLDRLGNEKLLEPISAMLTRLEDLGLAFATWDGVYVSDSVRYQIPGSLSDRHTIGHLLNVYDAQALKKICENLDLAIDTKVHNIAAITSLLLNERWLSAVMNKLPADEAAVLEALLGSGGSASPVEVANLALGGKSDDFFRYDWQSRWKLGRDRNAVDRLLSKGLIYVVPDGYGFNLQLVVPADLLRVMIGNSGSEYWTNPPPLIKYIENPPKSIARYDDLLRDIIGFLGYLASQDAPRTNTGQIHKTSLKNAARYLANPSEYHVSFVYGCCRCAGFIAPEGPKNAYKLTETGADWLKLDEHEQLQTVVNNWRFKTIWAEMFNEPLQKSNEYRDRNTIVRMRSAAIRLALEVSSEKFIEFDSFVEALVFRYPLLMSPRALLGESLLPTPMDFVYALFVGCLTGMGAVEIAVGAAPQGDAASRERAKTRSGEETTLSKPAAGVPVGFRFTPLGAYLLDKPGSEAPKPNPRERQFIVQANAEIFVPPFLAPEVLYRLLAITDPPAKTAAKNTVALSRESVRRAVDTGETGQTILAFLTSHSRTSLPQNVEYLIHEVAGKHGHIHIGRAHLYLQTDTSLLMEELLARKEVRVFLIRKLTDTVAVLGSDDPHKMIRELRKAGYLPVFDDEVRSAVRIGIGDELVRDTEDDLEREEAHDDGAGTSHGEVNFDSVNLSEAEHGSDEPTERNKATLDHGIDWNKIAEEDGELYKKTTQPELQFAAGNDTKANDIQQLTRLMNQAARSSESVLLCYEPDAPGPPVNETIRPESVHGLYVYARDIEGNLKLYALKSIISAEII